MAVKSNCRYSYGMDEHLHATILMDIYIYIYILVHALKPIIVQLIYVSTGAHRASIHHTHGRLTVRSSEVSKPQESGLYYSSCSEIWLATRQRHCRDACRISELCDHYTIQSRGGFETSPDLTVRLPSASWTGALDTISSWWRHQMETFSGLLALCTVNSPITGEFPAQRPVTRSFDVSLICAWKNG